MQGVSTPPVIGGMKYADSRFVIGNITRDTSLASGTQAITGLGFSPKAIIFLGVQNLTGEESVGIDNGTGKFVNLRKGDETNYSYTTNHSIFDMETGANTYDGYVSSLDADGFTITWVRTNTPTGVFVVGYLALR